MDNVSSAVRSVAGSARRCLFKAASHQLGYLLQYDDNIEALKREVQMLECCRDCLQRQVETAERNLELIDFDVQNWIAKVDKTTPEVEKLLLDEINAKKRRHNAWHLNLKQRCQFSKEAKQKALTISKIQDEEEFERVSYSAFFLLTLESRESKRKDIMKALNEDNVNIIGIYGQGGVGKTILVKEISRRVKEDKLYDTVVMALISHTPSIKNIQEQIANMLNLMLSPYNSESDRAHFLCERIMEEKGILVILDDVQRRIELADIGIPFKENHEGCKILLTSRSKNVCEEMDCQETFVVETLSKQESWELFKDHVGSDVEYSDISPIAREVVAQCFGLPIAIVIIARALKNLNKDLWMDATQQLKISSRTDNHGMQQNIIPSLELSYNYLQSEEAKSLFLFCSLFPEGFSIPIEDLMRYGIGLRCFKNLETVKDIRVRTRAAVGTLISSFLLIAGDGYYKGCVKMHDIVRDFALSIAPKYNHKGLQKGPNNRHKFEDLTVISLMSNYIHDLPDGLECPKLQALLLWGNFDFFYSVTFYWDLVNDKLVVPDTFFQGMKNLEILDLSKTQLLSLPHSLSLLANLRTLYLDDCKLLSDLSLIGMLSNLEILSLSKCHNVKEIPISFCQLSCLRLLDLTECRGLTLISDGVISSLGKLEELYMIESFEYWDVQLDDGDSKRNASLVELQALSHLTSLEIYIPNLGILPGHLPFFQNLTSFILEIGHKDRSRYLD